jgi:hypothetical protein
MTSFEKFITTVGVIFMLGASPFIYDHVVNHSDDEEYPYSGFTPDCPTWDEPLDERYLPRPTEDEEEAE